MNKVCRRQCIGAHGLTIHLWILSAHMWVSCQYSTLGGNLTVLFSVYSFVYLRLYAWWYLREFTWSYFDIKRHTQPLINPSSLEYCSKTWLTKWNENMKTSTCFVKFVGKMAMPTHQYKQIFANVLIFNQLQVPALTGALVMEKVKRKALWNILTSESSFKYSS